MSGPAGLIPFMVCTLGAATDVNSVSNVASSGPVCVPHSFAKYSEWTTSSMSIAAPLCQLPSA